MIRRLRSADSDSASVNALFLSLSVQRQASFVSRVAGIPRNCSEPPRNPRHEHHYTWPDVVALVRYCPCVWERTGPGFLICKTSVINSKLIRRKVWDGSGRVGRTGWYERAAVGRSSTTCMIALHLKVHDRAYIYTSKAYRCMRLSPHWNNAWYRRHVPLHVFGKPSRQHAGEWVHAKALRKVG